MENKNRMRSIQVKFRLSEDEEQQLKSKMQAAGTKNKSAYLRKMALAGYIVTRDYGAVRKATTELHRIGVNLNQIAKIANGYGDIPVAALQGIEKEMAQVWRQLLSRD